MTEPPRLAAARRHLSQAEAGFRSDEGLFHLAEGLALLEEVALDGEAKYRQIAANLSSAYADRICRLIRNLVASDPGLPQPDLEHLFKVLLAFDAGNLELPDDVQSLKIDVVRRLIDFYYEGYPAEEKQKALERLAGIVE
jgi:hypothetical protein